MTPECTVCGYAVEWLRACYTSAWRLTSDPDVLTPGRYVFAPDNTPFYPGWHSLWSGVWTTDEYPRSDLGEAKGAWAGHYNGAAPSPFPLAQVVGSQGCVGGPQPLPYACPEVVEADCGTVLPPKLYFEVLQATGIFLPFDGLKGPVEFGDFFGFDSWFTITGIALPPFLSDSAIAFGCNFGYILFGIFDAISGNGFQGIHPLAWDFDDPKAVPLHYVMENFDVVPSLIELRVTYDNPDERPDDPRTFIAGFDSRCFRALQSVPPITSAWPDLFTLPDQIKLATVSKLLYDSYAEAEAFVQEWLGPTAIISGQDDSPSTIPGYLIAVRGDDTYVCVSGTTNIDQVVFYCCYGATAPQNIGFFSTNFAWFLASVAVRTAVAASTANPLGRIFLQGHSYGGAIAHLMAASYLLANPDRALDLFTMGCPKVGDQRLVEILEPARKMRLANRGDLVVGAPPFLAEVLRVFPGIPLGLPVQFGFMRHCPGQTILEIAGDMVFSDESVETFDMIQTIVVNVLADLPLSTGLAHGVDQYLLRLEVASRRQ